MSTSSWSIGSSWHYWDPHIHTPGTKLNNGYGNTDLDWEKFIGTIEKKTPNPIALGITDYYSLDNYRRVVEYKQAGRLKNVQLIFPNIEFRLNDAIFSEPSGDKKAKAKPVNAHLLISPTDKHHVDLAEDFLRKITFLYKTDHYHWSRQKLAQVGRLILNDQNCPDDAAISRCVEQCRIDFEGLLRVIRADQWAKDNILLAVSGKEDGTGGMTMIIQQARRETLYANAQIIFSSSENDRNFFSGPIPISKRPKDIRPIPCIHGSDAHDPKKNEHPDRQRLCWIKAAPTFEGFRQILFEPIRRVRIAPSPPPSPNSRNTITSVRIMNTKWTSDNLLFLNPGLISIIGPKGSGKTALSDLVAAAGHEVNHSANEQSFIARAGKGKLLKGLTVELCWADGTTTTYTHDAPLKSHAHPRVVYLPQHFVESLCNPQGYAELSKLIEQLVFNALPTSEQMGQGSFSDLIDQRTSAAQPALQSAIAKIQTICDQYYAAKIRHAKLPDLESELSEAELRMGALKVQEQENTPTTDQTLSTRLIFVSSEIERIERELGRLHRLQGSVKLVQHQLEEIYKQANQSIKKIQDSQSGHNIPLELLDGPDWESFLIAEPKGFKRRFNTVHENIASDINSLTIPPAGSSLTELESYRAEKDQVQKKLGADREYATRHRDILRGIQQLQLRIDKLHTDIASSKEAKQEADQLSRDRSSEYRSIFQGLEQQEQIYRELSSHLKDALPKGSKLSLRAQRNVELSAWVDAGEAIMDKRGGPFQGRGTLLEFAQKFLLDPWQRATSQEICERLAKFIQANFENKKAILSKGYSEPDLYKWLYSTKHISVRYELLWDGEPLAQLSPGGRGLVLLSLYLLPENSDTRPLIIDQPEENLDPRTIFNDLIPNFRRAAESRQIIIVTHNANLVVNADSDQVIVADARRSDPRSLPQISYSAGGIEEAHIRDNICKILEGGPDAFLMRSNRYALTTSRNNST